MRNPWICLLVYSFILFACSNNSEEGIVVSFRDSILTKHFSDIDLIPFYDTNDFNYKVLNAYYHNDTDFLLKANKEIEWYKKSIPPSEFRDSCIHHSKLNLVPIDEAYRFNYSMAFCPYVLNVTVDKNTEAINLHFIIYQPGWDTSECRIINEYNKPLSPGDWNKIKEAIDYADYWGLKRDNNQYGVDGSSLWIEGFIGTDSKVEASEKINSVYRWSPEPSALFDAFSLVLKLSGNTQGCFVVR